MAGSPMSSSAILPPASRAPRSAVPSCRGPCPCGTPMFIGLARMVIFDMALALAIWASLFAAFVAEEKSGGARRAWYLASAIAAATATLTRPLS